MKKVSFFLVAMAVFAVMGVSNLAAQTNAGQPSHLNPILNIGNALDAINAVASDSIEARNSSAIFTTDVDDFIDVNYYNYDIGTFLFGDGNSTNTGADISAGFARTFEKFYLGAYFGGTLVSGNGTDDNGDMADKKSSYATGTWDTNLAVLFGTAKIGAIRLDLKLAGTDETSTYDGKTISNGATQSGGAGGSVIALTWGKTLELKGKEILPHVSLGYTFADYILNTDPEGDKKDEIWGSANPAAWLVHGGAFYDLNDISTLDASLTIGGDFGSTQSGDLTDVNKTVQGDFYTGLAASLVNVIEPVDGLSFGFTPSLQLGVYGRDRNESGDDTVDAYTDTSFEVNIHLAGAVKVRLPGKANKFTVVTGIEFDAFDWQVTGRSGGEDDTAKGNDIWNVSGINLPSTTLQVGLVFNPNDHLSIGFGLNPLLDQLFVIDPYAGTVTAGTFFTTEQPDVQGGALNRGIFGGLFNNGGVDTAFTLTVSYKF